jgi:hypothetical protein
VKARVPGVRILHRRVFGLLAALLVLSSPLHAATINVPSLELMTRGYRQSGLFGFTSRGEFELQIEGGYKFGGRIALSYDSTNLEGSLADVGVAFKSAGIEIRQLAGLPIGVSFFVGEDDNFCSGDVFPRLFGTVPITTRYRGFFYFPESIIYDGIHRVRGTGFIADFPNNNQRFLGSFYLYQDLNITRTVDGVSTFWPGHYSADFRALVNLERVKLEAFAGATYPTPGAAASGYFRGGLLFYAAETNVEFLAQLGIPRIAPGVDAFSINLLYLLFEPRVHLGVLHIIPTFFWHPQYYLQQPTGELGSFDVNLNFLFKSEALEQISGGIEANLVFRAATGAAVQQLTVKASPYLTFVTPGVLWDVKVNANLFPFNPSTLVDVFLGIRAEF